MAQDLFIVRMLSGSRRMTELLNDLEGAKSRKASPAIIQQYQAEINQYNNRLTDQVGRMLAETAMGYMAKKLSSKPIVASGGASQNFSTTRAVGAAFGKKGVAEWIVVEGDKTKANFFIRRGFKRSRGFQHMPLEKLRLWAAVKGVSLTPPEDRGKGKTPFTFVKSKTRKGVPYGRARNRKSSANAALAAVAHVLADHGSEFTGWKDLFPKGQGRYDYPREMMRNNNFWSRVMEKIDKEYSTALISYFTSGKRSDIYDKKLQAGGFF